ncbi:MAG TPA: glutamate-5-semialdehyde dehydrogenase [Acidobacteriaceae bacterium]|nr:glutamate-5-semialdehyde dehydrogenase [Acidobacteriaceae bacterium]
MSATDATTVRDLAARAKAASRILATLSETERNAALECIATNVERAAPALFAANAEDLQAAQHLTGADALSPATLSRLKLTEAKLAEMTEGIRSVIALPDPLGRILGATELDDQNPPGTNAAPQHWQPGLHLQKITVPLGVLAVIFEARPDAVTQIAALALKSGNAVILKAGREVERTATALVQVLQQALRDQDLPADSINLLLGRDQVLDLLGAHDLVDLVIPRGSRQLVEFVQANTRVPVLGHAEGICHIYVDRAADPNLALRVIADAKLDYPAACNAVETVLIHRDLAETFLPQLLGDLQSKGIRLHSDAAVQDIAKARHFTQPTPVTDWHHEYGEPELSLALVDSLPAAIAHIHQHGSSHTESILTEDPAAAEQFLREVDAAGVFHNASTRFADGFRYGFGAEVGISTSKLHARGPVGLDGLTTYKYLLRGQGHIAADYRGPNARTFTHRPKTKPQ